MPGLPLTGRLRTLAVAAVIAVGVLVWGGQVGSDGAYASQGDYRAQVSAFLDGRLALSRVPEGMQHDLVWTESGVQQVWGLAAPAWQTPFEVVGRAVGVSPFPDRVALVAFLVLVLYVSARAWWRRDEPWWLGVGGVVLTALLPAYLTLLRGRFGVYEEAAAYAYGGAIILLAQCARLEMYACLPRYLGICAAAGLAGFLRPTTWCYGLATFVVATMIKKPRARDLVLGGALFAAGGAALYATNVARFGAGFEFGHHLNLQAQPGNLYATRFSYPFERVGMIEAVEELGGAMFGMPERHVRTTFYGRNLHVGQSDQPRWREYYFSTFNWAYVPAIAAGLVLGVIAWRRRDGPGDPTARWLVVWAVLGGAPITYFYLHAPFFASRYALDLAPAIAALLVVAWRAVGARRVAAGVLAAAWLASLVFARTAPRTAPTTVGRAEAEAAGDEISGATGAPHHLPAAYDLRDPMVPTYTEVVDHFDRCDDTRCVHGERGEDSNRWHVTVTHEPGGATEELAPEPVLYLNMFRWDLETGQVPPATYAWLQDPDFVELDVATLDGAPGDWAHDVQVAVGRTHLHLTSTTPNAGTTTLRFESEGPLPKGLVVAFFAFGPDRELAKATTRFAVHAIRWRR